MDLHHLPTRNNAAAGNMAADFMLLQRYPDEHALRFRAYGWHRPAFTFGYSQKVAFVRAQLPGDDAVELCRRPTGGGVVDHRFDWTYALVIPRGHPAYDLRAVESYASIHRALAEALQVQQVDAVVKETCDPAGEDAPCGPGVCFTRAERYDVIRADTAAKLAGAAQKRNKHGLLFQGSVSRAALGREIDWDAFEQHVTGNLARRLEAETREVGWPDWSEDEFDGLVEQYASPEWNEFR